jgi:hypothetical protein
MSVVIVLGRVQVPALGGHACLAIIMRRMMVGIAPAAQVRARTGTKARRRSWTRATLFSGWGVHAQLRGLVIVHGLVTLFLEVIMLAIILLLIGLVALVVLVFVMRVIVVSIILMMIIGSSVVAFAFVASMIVAILATILPVAWITAAHEGKMSRLLLFWLLLLLGNLLKNAGRFFGSLTLLEKGDKPKWVHGHHLVCVHELKLMHLGLRKEDSLLFSCAVGNSIIWRT